MNSVNHKNDPDLELLVDLLHVIDRHAELNLEWNEKGCPEDMEYEDRAEHAMGLGFVACQAYLTAKCAAIGMTKSVALALGPRYNAKHTVAEAINHAANYWKHQAEWRWSNPTRLQERTVNALDACDVVPEPSEYPLSGILAELASPQLAAFMPIVPKLTEWNDEIRRPCRPTSVPPDR